MLVKVASRIGRMAVAGASVPERLPTMLKPGFDRDLALTISADR
jgi:hypothetical protein